jgi:ubiquitin-conjugating enzyme E2 W
MATRRLHKELSDWYISGRTVESNPQPAIFLETPVTRLDEWFVSLRGVDATLYAGEWYRLRFRFPSDYPIEAPEVVFLGTPPVHEHVYSNGHLCLSILYDSWSPALTVNSVALSIQSMLSSATEKRRPPDNDTYVRNCRGRSPKHTRWLFHDDGV